MDLARMGVGGGMDPGAMAMMFGKKGKVEEGGNGEFSFWSEFGYGRDVC